MNRMPIQTYVIPYKEPVIKELIERELGRNGQVFYLHNKVYNIDSVAGRLERLVKNAHVGVVHGQMDKTTIEDVMLKFYNNELNVLVCTSIIENGIDIANANMIIVEDADAFGLSQLYQIKGRVGRGNRIAYAYLLYKEGKAINEIATKRLKAIQDFTELGSGYKIAQRDLMIRGAGDILGPEQAGFIDTVGIDMYLKLLSEAIEEKKTGKVPEQPKPSNTLTIDAYIPAEYAGKIDKIELYQEIEAAHTFKQIETIHEKIRDIYGRLPEEVEKLLRKKKIDILSNDEAIEEVKETSEYVDVTMSVKFSTISGIGNTLFKAIIHLMPYIKVNYINKELKARLFKKGDWFSHLEELLGTIVRVNAESKDIKTKDEHEKL
jgi:transcription-repair coupling factor (superfamily II helicase)